MPITTLDPQTALVVIDLQKGSVAPTGAHPIEAVIKPFFPRRGETGSTQGVLAKLGQLTA